MKEYFNNIVETSKYLISAGISKKEQREQYLQNHESFVAFVMDIINQLQIAKRTVAEVKTFNLKYLKKEWLSIWKLESTSFKFFKNKGAEVKYKSSYDAIERIDNAISEEVEVLLKEQNELSASAWNVDNPGFEDPVEQYHPPII